MNWKTTHRIITKTEYLPYFIVKFKIKWSPASWLIIAFSGTGLPVMIQFCLLCLPFFIFKALFCKFFTLHHKGNTSMPSTLVTLNVIHMLRQMHTKGIKFNYRKCRCLSARIIISLKLIDSIGYDTSGAILVFWEAWQKHIVKCEEMKLCKIFDLNVKVKTEERKFRPINDS